MKKWYVIASLLIVMLLTNSCVVVTPKSSPVGKLEVLKHSLTQEDSGRVEVHATIKNVGSSPIDLAQVKVKFYDANQTLIETSTDGVMNLKPGESWDFEIACSGTGCDRVKTYEIEAIAATSSGGL